MRGKEGYGKSCTLGFINGNDEYTDRVSSQKWDWESRKRNGGLRFFEWGSVFLPASHCQNARISLSFELIRLKLHAHFNVGTGFDKHQIGELYSCA
jgi:hypothetical protein